MENITKNLMLSTVVTAFLGFSAIAQEMFRTEVDPVSIDASDFIGKRVYAVKTAGDETEYAGIREGWEDIGGITPVNSP